MQEEPKQLHIWGDPPYVPSSNSTSILPRQSLSSVGITISRNTICVDCEEDAKAPYKKLAVAPSWSVQAPFGSTDTSVMASWTLILLSLLLGTVLSSTSRCPPAITIDEKPQVFIMTDISNEPDDTQSLIRLLLHSDQYNITGLTAVTSYWKNSSTDAPEILNATNAYGKVVDNLNKHSDGCFPSAEYLASIVKSGHPVYGTEALKQTTLSSGAQHLINVVDGLSTNQILHCQAWGGTNVLAEALQHIRSNRSPSSLDEFTAKVRLYTISDQDNAGPWIRANFPSIPYIVSLHGFNQYGLAAWTGISGEQYYYFDAGGPDTSLVDQAYITKNFQYGPLGSHYPDIAFIMEGDSPTLMHTMQNGLNGGPLDHPEWGGWGGRYILLDPSRQSMVCSDATDQVVGKNGETFQSNHATIWRWRQAYQDEMAARMKWTILQDYEAGSHPPVVAVNGSCGSPPLEVDVHVNETVTLDATETWDPDEGLPGKKNLTFNWFHYRDITATQWNLEEVPQLNFTLSEDGRVARTKMPAASQACKAPQALQNQGSGIQDDCQQYHVILEVTGSGTPPIRRYKRMILKVQAPDSKPPTR